MPLWSIRQQDLPPANAIWKSCAPLGPGVVAFRPGVGAWLFAARQSAVWRKIPLSLQESAVCTLWGAYVEEAVVTWSWSTGQFRFTYWDGRNGTIAGTTPSTVVQDAQPDLFVANDGRVHVIGERALEPGAVARTTVLSTNFVGTSIVQIPAQNVTACHSSYRPVASFLFGGQSGRPFVCGPYSAPYMDVGPVYWYEFPKRMPYTAGTAGYSFGSDVTGRMLLIDGNSTWSVSSPSGSNVVYVPRSRAYMIAMINGVVYKTTFTPEQRLLPQIYTQTVGLPCSTSAQSYPSVLAIKSDAYTVSPRVFGNTWLTMVVNEGIDSVNATVLSVDVAAWTSECVGDPACFAELQTNPQHCGTCSRVCQDTEICAEGRCVPGSPSSASTVAAELGVALLSSLVLSSILV